MPGHRYQHNDRAGHDDQVGDDTGDPWLQGVVGFGRVGPTPGISPASTHGLLACRRCGSGQGA